LFRQSRIFYTRFLAYYCNSKPKLSSRDIKLSPDVIEISLDDPKISLDVIEISTDLVKNGLHTPTYTCKPFNLTYKNWVQGIFFFQSYAQL